MTEYRYAGQNGAVLSVEEVWKIEKAQNADWEGDVVSVKLQSRTPGKSVILPIDRKLNGNQVFRLAVTQKEEEIKQRLSANG